MNKSMIIGVIGDDLRQIYMTRYLIDKGYTVNLICSDNLDSKKDDIHHILGVLSPMLISSKDMYEFIDISDTIVTPIPFIKVNKMMNIEDFILNISQKTNLDSFFLYGGQIDENISMQLKKANIKYQDYYKSEALTIFNTISTAEGIIAEAIINKNTNIHNSNTLVLGYGNCAKTLANKLKGIGATVTIAARNKNCLKVAESVGYKIVDLHNLIMVINDYEYIFNTIPAPILNENILQYVNPEAIILDIASLPGGVNKEFAYNNKIKVIHKLGIPGIYSPKSSGIAIAEDLLNLITHKLT